MCGGRGTRLRPEIEAEKPLVEVGGRPLIDHVVAALRESRVETIYAAVSPATPETASWLASVGDVTVIETAGEGYIEDLGVALDIVERPVVTVTADLPLLAGEHIDRLISEYAGGSLSVCVPLAVAESVLDSVDTTVEIDGLDGRSDRAQHCRRTPEPQRASRLRGQTTCAQRQPTGRPPARQPVVFGFEIIPWRIRYWVCEIGNIRC